MLVKTSLYENISDLSDVYYVFIHKNAD